MANGFRRLVGDAARLGFSAQDVVRNAVRLTSDAFNEADHPREDGKFAKTAQEHATHAKHHEVESFKWQPHVRTKPQAQEYMVAHRNAAKAHREAAQGANGMSAAILSKKANDLGHSAHMNVPKAPV